MPGDFDESEPTRGEREASIPFELTNADVLKLWERTKASEAAANEAYVLAHRQARREIVAEAVEACAAKLRELSRYVWTEDGMEASPDGDLIGLSDALSVLSEAPRE